MKFSSIYNGEIELTEINGKHELTVNGYVESGMAVEEIWNKAFDKFLTGNNIKNVLILGFAGGSVVKLIRERFGKTKITGVEIDPVMVMIAKKYLRENVKEVKITIADAYDFVERHPKKIAYDLTILDCYTFGVNQPKNTKDLEFLKKIKEISKKVIMNQLLVPTNERMSKVEFLRDLNEYYPINILRLPFNAMIEY